MSFFDDYEPNGKKAEDFADGGAPEHVLTEDSENAAAPVLEKVEPEETGGDGAYAVPQPRETTSGGFGAGYGQPAPAPEKEQDPPASASSGQAATWRSAYAAPQPRETTSSGFGAGYGQPAPAPKEENTVSAPESAAAPPRETPQGGFGTVYPPQSNIYQQYRPYQPPYPNQGGYTPFTPGQYSNTYTPAQNQQAYKPVQQSPYQYSSNGGWQQPAVSAPDPQYQWDFQDYEKISEHKAKKKKSRGMVVFAVSLISVISICLIGISAYGVYSYVNGKEQPLIEDGLSDVPPESSLDMSEASQLEIAGKPQITESLPVGGKMTVPQVARAVGPSVVGVVQYQPDMYLQETGMGSGIIMSEDGYIITNAHVVAGGTAFKVVLSDGTPRDAELIGADTRTDLAVLKALNTTGLTPAVFGDSDEIEVGELVVAIGNPAGMELAGSVTQGIISAVNREIPTASYNMTYIQTDAAINPGNSGGALVNEYGQVIGINSSKIVAEGYEGIGFAIPISIAKPIVDDIITNGRVTGRVMLGIQGRVIDEIDARSAGLQMGIRIDEINPDSDIATKDIMRFDIITHIDGERIYDLNDLRAILDVHKPGDRVTLTISRALGVTRSNTFDVTITLMEDK